MVRKILKRIALALVVLLVIGGVGIYLSVSEPIEDMRLRADALPIPSDFVLVSESYSEGAFDFFGSLPHLRRTYQGSWLGACDTLRSIRDRSGELLDMAPMPPELADRTCLVGAWYPAGWRGWCRNYRHYQLRLTARSPEFVRRVGAQPPLPLVLYPARRGQFDSRVDILEGLASIDVELIAMRGR